MVPRVAWRVPWRAATWAISCAITPASSDSVSALSMRPELTKKKPGSISKVFSTHPMTDDRIKTSQEEIQKVLTAKPEYVVNTSEFNDVKGRLMMLHNRRKVDKPDDPSRPRLRRAPGSTTGPVDEDEDGKKPKSDQDERPTLKRRDQ